MIPSGLTSSVISRASLGDGYIRVRDSQLIATVAQFLYDEAALLVDEDTPWKIGRRRVLIDHSIESAGGQVSILL